MFFNRITLVGRITQDPTIKEITFNDTNESGFVAEISLAVPRFKKNSNGETETDFFSVNLYNTKAKQAAMFIKKESLCLIEGAMKIDVISKNDNKFQYPVITANEFRVLESKQKNNTTFKTKTNVA